MTAPLAYSLADAAAACGVSVDVIRRAVRANELPVRYPTSRPVVLHSDLEAWLHAAPETKSA